METYRPIFLSIDGGKSLCYNGILKDYGVFLHPLEDIAMRMRRMKNLDSRMDKCADLRIMEPAAMKGNWRSLKPDATALWV